MRGGVFDRSSRHKRTDQAAVASEIGQHVVERAGDESGRLPGTVQLRAREESPIDIGQIRRNDENVPLAYHLISVYGNVYSHLTGIDRCRSRSFGRGL